MKRRKRKEKEDIQFWEGTAFHKGNNRKKGTFAERILAHKG